MQVRYLERYFDYKYCNYLSNILLYPFQNWVIIFTKEWKHYFFFLPLGYRLVQSSFFLTLHLPRENYGELNVKAFLSTHWLPHPLEFLLFRENHIELNNVGVGRSLNSYPLTPPFWTMNWILDCKVWPL